MHAPVELQLILNLQVVPTSESEEKHDKQWSGLVYVQERHFSLHAFLHFPA